MAQLNIKKAPTVNAFSTTLNGAIGSTDLTLTLNSVTGLQNAAMILVIDRQDSSGNDTPTKREYIYPTSVSGSAVILPNTTDGRGQGGSTAQSHSDGAKVEAIMDISYWNGLITSYTVEHTDAGVHTAFLTDTLGASSTASLTRAYVGTATVAQSLAAASLATTSIPSGIQPEMISTGAITLGYNQITADVTTASTSFVQATGLTATVSIPAGGRKIKITVFTSALFGGTTNTQISLWDGTVGSGTQLSAAVTTPGSTGNPVTMMAVVTPAAGAKTYNVGFKQAGGGTADIQAASTAPAFILVEAI